MDESVVIECSVQIDDLHMEIFSTHKKLLRIPFYEKTRSDIADLCILHTHSYAEVFACDRGSINIRTPQALYTLSAGDVAIVPAWLVHTKLNGDSADTKWCSAGVMCTECKTLGDSGLYRSVAPLILGDNITVIKNRTGFYKGLTEVISGAATPFFKTGVAYEFCRIANEIGKSNNGTPGRRKSIKSDIDRLFKLDVLINTKYMHNVSNKQLADELYLSERQLSRFVNLYYGVPLHTLIINRRVEVAAAMLLKTNKTVEVIAEEVGFNSKTGFYREFNRVYGRTPLQFRKENGVR